MPSAADTADAAGTAKPSPKPRKRRLRIVLRAIALGAVALAALGVASSIGIDWYCEAHPPALEGTPAIVGATVAETEGIRRIGNAYLAERQGVKYMELSGTPFEMGYCNGALSQEYVQQQEQELLDTVRSHIPSPLAFWLIKKYVILRNRNLPDYISADRQMEIYGITQACEDPFPEIGPFYHRILNYHAAHDIAHAVMDNPLVACTSFAAWDTATADGHFLFARNFDFEAGRGFDINKIVMRVRPDRGQGFLSIAWPGMIGVVTGVNESKIAVAVQTAFSEEERSIGTPVSLVLRDVLQYASTLDEAIQIIRKSTVFVSDCYLVADGKIDQAVVVEKTPNSTAVYTTEGDYIICANHFRSPALADDTANRAYMVEGTTVPRMARMEELVRQNEGALTPEVCATILRDRAVQGVEDVGMGNAAAINPLLATHSVIMDLTDGIVWVSASPHQLGAYVPFGLDDFEDPPHVDAIPPDPILENGAYDDYLESERLIDAAETSLEQGAGHDQDAETISALRNAIALNPGGYRAPLLLGTLLFDADEFAQARAPLEEALVRHPPYASQREAAQEMLQRIESHMRKDSV